MKVLTTTLCYPTPDAPDQGVFVQRRAATVASHPTVDLHVVAPQPTCPLLRKASNYPATLGRSSTRYPRMLSIPLLSRALDGWSFARTIERYIAGENAAGQGPFDLIDAHFVYPDGVGAWRAGRRLGIPVVVTVRGKIVSLSQRTLRRLQMRAMLRGVQGVIAVSESLRDSVHRLAGSDVHVDVIPNGVDAATFHWIDRQRARKLLGWDARLCYVLAVGHLQHVKGFDRLVDIWPRVRMTLGDVRLILAGSERGERRYRRRLLAAIEACNTTTSIDDGSRSIHYVGAHHPQDLNLMYNAADLTVSASRSEGWSNAISESLATGTPVVATAVGAVAQQIDPDESGLIVPNGDDDALATAIVEGLGRDWNRPRIARNGAARTWQHTADEVLAVFERVLQARPRSAHAAGLDLLRQVNRSLLEATP